MLFYRRTPPKWARLSTLVRAAKLRAKRPAAKATKAIKAEFGSNPGGLRMHMFAPPRLPAHRPLVVLLHGCGQHAEAFADHSGWTALARELKFALVLPEQSAANNPGLCFNWYRPEDVRRGGGEAMSIRQMLRACVVRNRSDRRRVFVAGFSAGAAMAVAVLAAYPAVFAGGACVAGLPVGCASTPVGAALRMRRADIWRPRLLLAGDVRTVTHSATRKIWPRLSVWTGEEDRTVDPANAGAVAAQWSQLHGFGPLASADTQHPRARQQSWSRPGQRPAVELWTIPGLGHGYPISGVAPAIGREGPWVSECGLSAAEQIAAFWQLAG